MRVLRAQSLLGMQSLLSAVQSAELVPGFGSELEEGLEPLT